MPIALATVATFVAVSAIAWSLFHTMMAESTVTQRVKGLVGESPRPAARERAQRGERSGRLGRVVAAIGSYGVGADSSLAQRLSAAGFRRANAAALFLGVRTLISVGPAL